MKWKRNGVKNLLDDKAVNYTAIELLQKNLRPVLSRMLEDAPEWGTVGLNLIFNAGSIKRIEISFNESRQWDDGKR
jgi:hypothetical protein